MKIFPEICNKESSNVKTSYDLWQILEKYVLEKINISFYMEKREGLVPFIQQKAVIAVRAIA